MTTSAQWVMRTQRG